MWSKDEKKNTNTTGKVLAGNVESQVSTSENTDDLETRLKMKNEIRMELKKEMEMKTSLEMEMEMKMKMDLEMEKITQTKT
jgi:hypothetical protein